MRLVITGGGTGGHIYPALEVGRFAREHGVDLQYLGSLRGQESKICQPLEIPFFGFPSEPLVSLRSIKGIKAILRLQRARKLARVVLKDLAPDIVFSTGGYSAGPVVAAAKDLKIPYNIHSADSVPARSSSMFAKDAFAFSCTFRSTVEFLSNISVVRTGQPIRKELREAAAHKSEGEPLVLVVGGSQGSKFLNESVPEAAALGEFMTPVLHVSGPKHLESTQQLVEKLDIEVRYKVVPFLNATEMSDAYLRASVVVARSGGTLAELALFGLPSVLIPLPNSASDHQVHNAVEFVNLRAATQIRQSDGTPEKLSTAVNSWLKNRDRRLTAARNLEKWDVPDATEQIYKLIELAVP